MTEPFRRTRDWWALHSRAVNAYRKVAWHARLPGTRKRGRAGTDMRRTYTSGSTGERYTIWRGGKSDGWPKTPVYTGYRPTIPQWRTLFALEDGPLMVSDITVPGATVNLDDLKALEYRDLVLWDHKGKTAGLSDTGRALVEWMTVKSRIPDPADPRHGTTTGYWDQRCRCDRCRAAKAEDMRRYRGEKQSGA